MVVNKKVIILPLADKRAILGVHFRHFTTLFILDYISLKSKSFNILLLTRLLVNSV